MFNTISLAEELNQRKDDPVWDAKPSGGGLIRGAQEKTTIQNFIKFLEILENRENVAFFWEGVKYGQEEENTLKDI